MKRHDTGKVMKYVFLMAMLLFPCAAQALDVSYYEQQLDVCKQKQKEFLESVDFQTTAMMKQSVYNLNDCYEAVAYELIDKHYAHKSAEVKENLTNFLISAYAATGDVYFANDYCPGSCGTLHGVLYVGDTARLFREMIMLYINRIRDIMN